MVVYSSKITKIIYPKDLGTFFFSKCRKTSCCICNNHTSFHCISSYSYCIFIHTHSVVHILRESEVEPCHKPRVRARINTSNTHEARLHDDSALLELTAHCAASLRCRWKAVSLWFKHEEKETHTLKHGPLTHSTTQSTQAWQNEQNSGIVIFLSELLMTKNQPGSKE